MNNFIYQLRSSNAAERCWQSYANANSDGGSRLSGMKLIPAHSAFDRCDSLATISGEPMT